MYTLDTSEVLNIRFRFHFQVLIFTNAHKRLQRITLDVLKCESYL